MLLYRAQSVPSGQKIRAPQDNDPATRVRGRWFTDDIEAAYRHATGIEGPAQIVCIELADDVAETFRVATTPVTPCGLEPIHHSAAPMSDFVIPRFFAAQAEIVESVADEDRGEVVSVDFGYVEFAVRQAA
jgi:hypothetical protein